MLGLQWAGQGSADAAMALLVAAGDAARTIPWATEAEGGEGGGKGNVVLEGIVRYYMAEGSALSAAKAKVFFEQWDEDKGVSLTGGGGGSGGGEQSKS